MSGHLTLTPEEQTTLTNALALEARGYVEAARWLRSTIRPLRDLSWEEKAKDVIDRGSAAWERLFKTHRGSPAPFEPKPAAKPEARKTDIRPDQPTA